MYTQFFAHNNVFIPIVIKTVLTGWLSRSLLELFSPVKCQVQNCLVTVIQMCMPNVGCLFQCEINWNILCSTSSSQGTPVIRVTPGMKTFSNAKDCSRLPSTKQVRNLTNPSPPILLDDQFLGC